MMKTVIGISPDDRVATFEQITVKPYIFDDLQYAKGHYDSPRGRIEVEWHKNGNVVQLEIIAPCDEYVYYNGVALKNGKNIFTV
jgi:alpha-L-rhamnosidase